MDFVSRCVGPVRLNQKYTSAVIPFTPISHSLARISPDITVFRFSVKWRGSVPLLVSVPPLRGGDFQGIRVYRSDAFWGRARKVNFRARHRLDEPAKLSLGLVASLQSPLPFRLAKPL